jgi:hypothetical protein
MKKLAIILALLLVPMAAFGMDTISDSDLEAVTGQAGVSIALNSIAIQNSGGTTSYGDVDSGKWLSIVGTNTRSRTIGFHGQALGQFDALTIDIVDITDVNDDGVVDLNSLVVATDLPATASAAVKIALCDIIQIEEDQAQIKHIVMSGAANASDYTFGNEIIATYSSAGTTRIIAGGMGTHTVSTTAASGSNVTSAYAYTENTTILISAH